MKIDELNLNGVQMVASEAEHPEGNALDSICTVDLQLSSTLLENVSLDQLRAMRRLLLNAENRILLRRDQEQRRRNLELAFD